MPEIKIGHVVKLPLNAIDEVVDAMPLVACAPGEVKLVLSDLHKSVDKRDYIPQTPTVNNPSLSDDYIFDVNDEELILKDLTEEYLVGKIVDLSKGAQKRKARGFPQEYLYVFKYPCKLMRRDSKEDNIQTENILIYIKINFRTIPDKKVIIVSFHKNRPKK